MKNKKGKKNGKNGRKKTKPKKYQQKEPERFFFSILQREEEKLEKKRGKKKMNYYTSDIHFGQKALLKDGKYHERPFTTLEEMQSEIIKRWNKKVTNADHVYILGDVGARGANQMHPELLACLKGNKHLILGNHDDVSDLRVRQQFAEICHYKKMFDNKGGKAREVILSHYPILMWEGQHRGAILLYGHVHNTVEEAFFQKYLAEFYRERPRQPEETDGAAYNVGMALWDYTPVSLDEMIENQGKKEIRK